MNIDILLGKIIKKIDITLPGNEMIFTCSDNTKYKFFHYQDCCENVYIADIDGDLNDLIDLPLLSAQEISQNKNDGDNSATWTFYKFSTTRGFVTIRWIGESNGYYSESVDIEEIIF